MRPFTKRERAQRAAACVGVDAGKFTHTLVVRPRGQPESRPFTFPTTRTGFDDAVAFVCRHAGGAPPEAVLVGIEFAGNYGFTFAHYLAQLGFPVVSVLPASTKHWKLVVHGQLSRPIPRTPWSSPTSWPRAGSSPSRSSSPPTPSCATWPPAAND